MVGAIRPAPGLRGPLQSHVSHGIHDEMMRRGYEDESHMTEPLTTVAVSRGIHDEMM